MDFFHERSVEMDIGGGPIIIKNSVPFGAVARIVQSDFLEIYEYLREHKLFRGSRRWWAFCNIRCFQAWWKLYVFSAIYAEANVDGHTLMTLMGNKEERFVYCVSFDSVTARCKGIVAYDAEPDGLCDECFDEISEYHRKISRRCVLGPEIAGNLNYHVYDIVDCSGIVEEDNRVYVQDVCSPTGGYARYFLRPVANSCTSRR